MLNETNEYYYKYTYGGDNHYVDFLGSLSKTDMEEYCFRYIPEFIDKKKCEILKNIVKPKEKVYKGLGLWKEDVDPNYRKSDIFAIDDDEINDETPEGRIYKEILENFLICNDKFFQAKITNFTKIQYTYYDRVGEHFNWHPDGCLFHRMTTDMKKMPDNILYRKLTLVLCLSDHEEYEGGEFLIMDPYTTPDRAIVSHKFTTGEAIMFPSFLFHKVNPIIKGERKIIAAWGTGPKWE
jgi:PKHD-type hydroxylase